MDPEFVKAAEAMMAQCAVVGVSLEDFPNPTEREKLLLEGSKFLLQSVMMLGDAIIKHLEAE